MYSSNLAWKVSHPVKNFPAVFAPGGLLDELLLTKFSYPGLGCPMDFIPRDPNCCSFHTRGSFLPPWSIKDDRSLKRKFFHVSIVKLLNPPRFYSFFEVTFILIFRSSSSITSLWISTLHGIVSDYLINTRCT